MAIICRFDKKRHKYYADEEALISVTQCLKPLDDFTFVKAEVLERKRRLGINVHNMVELHETGKLEMRKLTDSMKQIHEQYLEFKSDHPKIFKYKCFFEKQVYSPRIGIAGTPDIFSTKILIDIKSRPVHRYRDALQLTGYDITLGDEGGREHWILELSGAGYKFTKLYYPTTSAVFLKLLKHEKERLSLIKLCKHEERNKK
jgi:hypothetical protein